MYVCMYVCMYVFLFPLLSGSASFPLCCADEFTKNETACCPQIEYVCMYVCMYVRVCLCVVSVVCVCEMCMWIACASPQVTSRESNG